MRYYIKLLILTLYILVVSQSVKSQIQVNSVISTVSTCPNNGSITVNATSPSPPILYSIESGPVMQQVQTNPVFNSLPAGNYTVKISDGAGNEVLEAVTIGGNYQNPAFTTVSTSPYCLGQSNGKLVMDITNGTGLAPYSWQLVSPSPVTGTQSSNVFENLPAGNYSVRVTDACGSVRTNAVTITAPNTNMEPPALYAKKVGCDSMLITYRLPVNEARFPLSFSYLTTNGTYVPAPGTTTIDSTHIRYYGNRGWVDIEQVIPGMTYGHYVRATITNTCGNQVISNVLNTYPFVFYPAYQYSLCGDTATAFYENPPVTNQYHTFLKAPVTFSYVDLSTNDTVSSGVINQNHNIVGASTGRVSIPGKTYRFTITDGCGQSFTRDYTIPALAPPTATHQFIYPACMDSVARVRIPTTGFGTGRRMVIISGPPTLGSVKPGYEYSDTYTWPSDTIYSSNNPIFFISNLAPGTYQYKVFDDCGRELIRSFTITPQHVTKLSRIAKVEKGCPGENKIIFSIVTQGTVTIRNLSDNSVIKITDFTQSGLLQDSVLHVPSGQYEITYDYAPNAINPLNDGPVSCWKIVDTITIPPYQNPEIAVGNGIMCDDQIQIELIPDTTKGVAPFQYEIFSGPEIFPLQNSNVFTVNTAGTYYARIFDKCGNATMKQVTIDTLSFDPIELATDCISKKIVFPPSIYYTYEWIKPNEQIHIGDSLVLNPVTAADTGTYRIFKIININGCVDTLTTTYQIDLPNYSEQTIPFCEGTAVVVGGNIYDTPGVYTDTLITAAGCDSLIVTTLILLPQVSDTTVVSICDGDSVLISGNYYSVSGFYSDSIQNIYGCYDLQVTQLTVIGQFPSHQYITLCNNDSYSVGNHTYTATGTYYDTIQSTLGCDSIVVLYLEVLTAITHSVNQTICEGDYYVFGGNALSVSGTYTDTLLSVHSCDSVVTLYLNVLPIKYDTISVSICEGESFYFGGQTLTDTGTYTDTLETNSCDSIVTLNLVVLPHKYYQVYDTICEGSNYVFGGSNYAHSGVYTYRFPTSACDSIVTLNLTIIPAPSVLITSVVMDGDNESAVVQLNGVSVTSPLTYFWESNSVLSNNVIKNPTITIKEPEWITLTVTDKYGCTSTADHRIELPVTSTLYIPNAVTPDGNEFNNIFRVYGTNISTFHILIFNRWGEIIFESNDFNFGWDATYKGVIVQDGVYTYKLSAVGMDGVYYNKTGHITVIK